MPTLHELFDAATDGMPPLPDLAPSARRIARKQLATRTSAAVLSSALVIGAGTFALSVQHSGNARDAASGPPHAYNQQYVIDTLQSLWPNKNQQLSAMPGAYGIIVTQDGQQVAFAYFSVLADVSKFPEELNCFNVPDDCLRATTDDGDKVLAEHSSIGYATATVSGPYPSSSAAPGAVPATLPGSTPATDPATIPATVPAAKVTMKPIDVAGQELGYRLHGTYFGRLTVTSLKSAQLMSDQQMLGIMESAAYEQLIESAVAASSLDWFGTPPAGIPSDTATY